MANEWLVETGVDLIAVSVAPKKWFAYKTLRAYGNLLCASAKYLPACAATCAALSGEPALSQVQARHNELDEHIASTTHDVELLEGDVLEQVSVSGDDVRVPLTGSLIIGSQGKLTPFNLDVDEPTPLPLRS